MFDQPNDASAWEHFLGGRPELDDLSAELTWRRRYQLNFDHLIEFGFSPEVAKDRGLGAVSSSSWQRS